MIMEFEFFDGLSGPDQDGEMEVERTPEHGFQVTSALCTKNLARWGDRVIIMKKTGSGLKTEAMFTQNTNEEGKQGV